MSPKDSGISLETGKATCQTFHQDYDMVMPYMDPMELFFVFGSKIRGVFATLEVPRGPSQSVSLLLARTEACRCFPSTSVVGDFYRKNIRRDEMLISVSHIIHVYLPYIWLIFMI